MRRARLGLYISEYSKRNKMDFPLPVYSVTNSQGFCQQYFNKVVASENRSTYKVVPRGCFAYNPSRINVGSIDWQRNEERVIVSPLYVVFQTSMEMDNQFLYYYLRSDVALTYIKNWGQGSVRDNLKFTQLSQIPINVYPIEEQQLIAQRLDVLSKLISLRQRQTEKLDELVKARFVEMFGDPVRNTKLFPQHELKEYIQFLTSGSRGWAKFFSDDGELFITIKNVKNGHINLSDIQHVMPPDNAEAKRTKVQAGDLLISITADLGRTGVVSDNLAQRGAYINQHLTCIRLKKDEVLPQYVSAFLESAAGKRQFSAKNQSAVKAGLNFEAIKSLRLFMPPLELQREYIAFVNEVDREKERIQRSAALLETLKRSLMQQYFG